MSRNGYIGRMLDTDTLTTDAAQLAAIQALLGIAPPSGGMVVGDPITGATAGSVLFAGAAGVLAQDNANLFWDDTNNRLGVGTATPQAQIEMVGPNSARALMIVRTPDANQVSTIRCYNSFNSGTRSLDFGRSGTNGDNGLPNLTGGLVGEVGYVTTTNDTRLELGTNQTLRAYLDSAGLTVPSSNILAAMYRLGVGVASPAVALEVVGTGALTYIRNTVDTSTCFVGLLNDINSNTRALAFEYTGSAYSGARITDGPSGEQGIVYTRGAYPLVLGTNGVARVVISSAGKVSLQATNTAAGTTGAQTIDKPTGKVNFAAAATSLVVTNALCTAASIVWPTMLTNDTTARDVWAVPTAGSFTIYMDPPPTAEVAVGFLVLN